AEFARRAAPIIADCRNRNKNIVVVGGAGFYLKALVEGIPDGEAPDPETRSWIEAQIEQLGSSKAHQWLKERDPQSADRIHANDLYRIGRALEKSYSAPALPAAPFFDPGLFRFYGLEQARSHLDLKLKERTVTMWRSGLLDEVEFLKNARVTAAHPVWGAIGYREAADFLDRKISESQAKEKIFRRTRQYAKRQWTWFKRQHLVQWINLDEKNSLAEAAYFILSDLQKTKGDS
ncbi:MAG: tRNA (adenosine(37)-N6)-dimethylallyltransferase MiaA, partial [bacterium]